jgi:hypothetical protein
VEFGVVVCPSVVRFGVSGCLSACRSWLRVVVGVLWRFGGRALLGEGVFEVGWRWVLGRCLASLLGVLLSFGLA